MTHFMQKIIYIIPFAHLDLFWAGTRHQCLSRGDRIINTALTMLANHPDYRFMIESTAFLESFINHHPTKKELVRKFVEEGRLELIPMRGILYSHLPSGETTVRNLISGKRFCRQHFGVEPELMSLSDIPGISSQVPQIAKLAGFQGLLLSRGFAHHTDNAIMTAPDGTEIAAFHPRHYASFCSTMTSGYGTGVDEEKMNEMLTFVSETDDDLIMHLGTDLYVCNENVYQTIQEWNSSGGNPQLSFLTFSEYFKKIRPTCRNITRISGEQPSTWAHIESSWPDLWPSDIPAECAMANVEYFASLLKLSGHPFAYPAESMEKNWNRLIDGMDHNQNGIGGPTADRDKLALKEIARLTAEDLTHEFAGTIATKAEMPREGLFPVVLFNTLSWKRTGIVRTSVAAYGPLFATPFPDVIVSVHHYKQCCCNPPFRLLDEEGHEVPFKIEQHLQMLSDTFELSFCAELPAFGAKVFYLEAAEGREFPSPFIVDLDSERDSVLANRNAESDKIENDFYRLEIDRITGEWDLFDKKRNRMLVQKAGLIGYEERRGEYIYNMTLSGRSFPATAKRIELRECNAVYAEIRIEGSIYGLSYIQTIRLPAADPSIEVENILDWRIGHYVRIEQRFPFATEETPEISYGVPFGQVRYPERLAPAATADPTVDMRLVQHWINCADSGVALSIGADHRLWEIDGNEVRNCMLRGIGWTSGGTLIDEDGKQTGVARPPSGQYTFRFRLEALDLDSPRTGRCGMELNRPVVTMPAADAKTGTPGLRLPVMPAASENVTISWVKPAEDGNGVVFRCYESAGHSGELRLPSGNWTETNLMENDAKNVSGTIVLRPFEIKTLKKNLEKN
jgi:alpha-mannosidase